LNSFIHSGYFYSASLSLLLIKGAPDKARILHRSFMPRRQGNCELRTKVPTWQLEWDSMIASTAISHEYDLLLKQCFLEYDIT